MVSPTQPSELLSHVMSSEPLQSNDLKKPGPASIAYYVRAVHEYAPTSAHSSDMEQSDEGT